MNIGETFNGYRLIKSLGSGANAEVWLAELEETQYALKVLINKKNEGTDKDKYDKEVNSWKKANGHPNIITIHDDFRKNGKYVIVLDFAEEGSLESKKFAKDEVLDIFLQILNGVAHLHKLNIIHRDIKPENIMMKKGVPCLGDFGLARDLALDLTQTTNIGGSERYFSPELAWARFNNEGGYKRSINDDLWAVAVTFYKIITGINLFPSLVKSEKAERENYPADFPADLIEFFDKAFQKEKSNRFQSAEEMLMALKNVEQERFRNELVKSITNKLEKEYRQKFETELNPLKELNVTLEKQINQLKYELSKFENKIKTKDEEILILGDKIVLLSSENYLEKEKYHQQVSEEKYKLLKEVKSLKSKVAKLESQNKVGIKLFDKEGRIINNPENDKVKKDEQISETDKAVAELKKRNSTLENLLKNKDSRISELKSQIPPPNKFFSRLGKITFAVIVTSILVVGGFWIYNLFPPRYIDIANNCLAIKDYNCAISTYEQAIERYPNYSVYYANLGDIYRYKLDEKDRNQDKAIELYNKALEKNTNNPDAYFGLGWSFNEKGNYDEAIKNYEKCNKRSDCNANLNLANIYSNESYDKRDYKKAKDLYEKTPDTSLKFYNLGFFYQKENTAKNPYKDNKKAIDNFKLYLEKEKGNSDKQVVDNIETAKKEITKLEAILAKELSESFERFLKNTNSNSIYFNYPKRLGLNSNSNISLVNK